MSLRAVREVARNRSEGTVVGPTVQGHWKRSCFGLKELLLPSITDVAVLSVDMNIEMLSPPASTATLRLSSPD